MIRHFGCALALIIGATWLLPAQQADHPFVVRDVRLFDGERVSEHQTVVVEGGTITAVGGSEVRIPPAAEEISGRGRTLLPGLMDAHIHLPAFPVTAPAEALRQSLALGVTTAVVMAAAPSQFEARLKALETADAADTAAILTAGNLATVPGGHPTQMGGPDIPTLTTPGEADAFVAARLAEGSDFIKIVVDDLGWMGGRHAPTLDAATVAALVAAAHRRDRLAVAHISSEAEARTAIASGVDGLAHLFLGASASPSFGEFAASHHVFVIPTLSVLSAACGVTDGAAILQDTEMLKQVKAPFRAFLEMPNYLQSSARCEAAPQAVRQLAAAKVPLLAGTDTPAPGMTYGASLHVELEHLVDAGLTPVGALIAATAAPATAFHLTDRGRIRPGLRADLLLVDGDPSTRIRDSRNIVAVWKKGIRAERMP